MEIQFTLNEKDLQELISLLQRTNYFAATVIEAYKFDGTFDSFVSKISFDASGHLYQSSGYLLSLFKDLGLIEKDKK